MSDVSSRFWAKVDVAGGYLSCWEWTASTDSCGYGRFGINGKLYAAHRVAYEQHVGPIGSGLELDHLCRNTKCCNPIHLEPVSHAENVRRGVSGKQNNRNKEKTACPLGHSYSGSNLYVRKSGVRQCRACHSEQEKRRRSRA